MKHVYVINVTHLDAPLLFSITQDEPIWADLDSGVDHLPDLANITTLILMKLNKKAELCCLNVHHHILLLPQAQCTTSSRNEIPFAFVCCRPQCAATIFAATSKPNCVQFA